MKKNILIILILFLVFCNYSFAKVYDYNVYSPNLYNKVKSDFNEEKIIFIVDFSNSMNDYIGGKRKIDLALMALKEILPHVPQNIQTGLRVYGQRQGITALDACMASKLVVPIGYNNLSKIYSALERIMPIGMTPITYSIKQSLKSDFGLWNGKKRLIILTDGGENCDESPCDYAIELLKLRNDVKIDVIAFSVNDTNALSQLRCTALVTNGKFYNADTYADLLDGLKDTFKAKKNVEGVILTK